MNNAPRRRTSAFLQEAIDLDKGYTSAKLSVDDEELSQSKKRRKIFGFETRNVVLVLTVLLVAVLLLLARIWHTPQQRLFDIETENEDEYVAIRLHPEEHVYREPRNLSFDWKVTTGWRAPDGVQKQVYLINGLFPGPTIESRSGDNITVTVQNALNEGLSIHWHGLHMKGSNHMDGAVGFTQSPIPAGDNFTYRFQISLEQQGTFWCHAHSHVQRGDGLYGGLVVHRPASSAVKELRSYEQDMLLLIGDWFHRSAEEMLGWYTSTRGFGNEPVPDSLVINGVGDFNCSMAVPARPLECSHVQEKHRKPILPNGRSTRLRIVNVGSIAGITIEMENAQLLTTHVDAGFEITAAPANSVGILYPGERMDLDVQWSPKSRDVGARFKVTLDSENFKYLNPALAPIQSFPALPRSSIDVNQIEALSKNFDLQTASPLQPPIPAIPESAQHTLVLYTKTLKLSRFGNHPMGFINRTSWAPQEPALISLPRSAWDTNQLVPFIPFSKNTGPQWVDIIINNLDDGSHPFHLHGHDFWVLITHRSDNGWGSYNPYSENEKDKWREVLNVDLTKVVRKDTVMVPRRGFVLIRFRADNEGIWMFHCHLLVHLGSGMAMGIQVGGEHV